MKIVLLSFILLTLSLQSCNEKKENSPLGNQIVKIFEIPKITVLKSALVYNHNVSIWSLNDSPFSGFAISYYENGNLKEKFGILNGKKQNKSSQWFSDGNLKNISHYHQGKLHGEKKVWSSGKTNILLAHLQFKEGQAHGKQKKWYPTGELHKKLNLNNGKEEGIQQAYRKNGALYANYEAREGRIFGLKKTALCYGLEDENITYEN